AAHFMEHMLFRSEADGAKPAELIAAVEGRGGQVNAQTSRDSVLVQIVTSPRLLPDLWPVLARTLLEPQITDEGVAEEKKVVAQEMAEREGQALDALTAAVWAAAYPNHPYGRSIGGTREALEALDAARLREYHARFFTPNNMALILVGDISADEVFTQAQQAFGSYSSRAVDWTAPNAEAPFDGPRTDVQTQNVAATLIGMGFRGPGIQQKRDVCAMDLIYTVLSDGRQARFVTELEAKGLATAFDLQYITQRDEGLVLITAATPPDKELEARAAIARELRRLAEEGVTEQTLTRSKRVLRNSYAFSNEAYSDQVGSLGFYEMIDTYRFAVDYIDAVDQVTAEDIRRVAAEYLTSEKAVLVIFRPPTPRQPGTEV
ncbi:MAG: insulinase family protein, partial [Armatimonadetes bacterium]|nr:insulinase family protein [Armatimonadota bacterium]